MRRFRNGQGSRPGHRLGAYPGATHDRLRDRDATTQPTEVDMSTTEGTSEITPPISNNRTLRGPRSPRRGHQPGRSHFLASNHASVPSGGRTGPEPSTVPRLVTSM